MVKRKTRRNKSKKKRHIITRKNKRKRRRKTKKRRKGGMPKTQQVAENKRVKQIKNAAFRPIGRRAKKFQKKSSSLSSKLKLKRAVSVRSGLNTVSNRDSPAAKMFQSAQQQQQQQQQQQTQAPQLVPMMEGLNLGSETLEQPNESKQ